MRNFLSAARSAMPILLVDAVGVLALANISYGFWLAWHPLGFIFGGGIVLAMVLIYSGVVGR